MVWETPVAIAAPFVPILKGKINSQSPRILHIVVIMTTMLTKPGALSLRQ